MDKIKKCPFCGDLIKEFAFLESTNFIVIYNRAPVLPGHSMIVPKKHISSLLDLTSDQRSEMMELSIIAIELLQKVFKVKAFNYTIQEGVAAGQTIEHLHLHIIPRKEADLPDPGDWYPMIEKSNNDDNIDSGNRNQYSVEELKNVVDMIKSYLD